MGHFIFSFSVTTFVLSEVLENKGKEPAQPANTYQSPPLSGYSEDQEWKGRVLPVTSLVCIASHELSAYWASEISSPMSLLFRGETEAWREARSLQGLLGKKTSEGNASPSQLSLPRP